MKKEKLGQEPAFPHESVEFEDGQPVDMDIQKGMSKRFYAACAALKSPLLREDALCDDDMIEDGKGYYIKHNGSYFIPTNVIGETRYSIKPESTEITRIVRYARKLADELLTQENE